MQPTTDACIVKNSMEEKRRQGTAFKTYYLVSTLKTTWHVPSLIKGRDFKEQRDKKKIKNWFVWKKMPRKNSAQCLNSKEEKVEHCLLLVLYC